MCLQEKQVQSGLSFFSCGDKDLDDFFHCDAAEYEHALFGKTYAFVHKKSGEISSMFTISNGSVQERIIGSGKDTSRFEADGKGIS